MCPSYVATTHEPVTPELVARLQTGVKLIDEPELLNAQARQVGASEVEIVLDMGKYHQVKRMLAAAGSHCVALWRTAIGGLTLLMGWVWPRARGVILARRRWRFWRYSPSTLLQG